MKKGYIIIHKNVCKGCGFCVQACPKGGIRMSEGLNIKGYHPAEFVEDENSEERTCTGCTLCAVMCPEVCIEVFRD